MNRRNLELGQRVRKAETGWTGTVTQVYSQDWANMTDTDARVAWDNGRTTNESAPTIFGVASECAP